MEPREFTLRAGEGVIVRTILPEDAAALLDFLRAAAATTDQILTSPDEFPATVEEERAFVERHLADGASVFLVATHEGAVAGVLDVRHGHRRRNAHTGEVGMLIGEAWRGRGVGTCLMRVALEWATAHPTIEKVWLTVNAGNEPALALYRKMGFVEEGRQAGHGKLGPGRYVDWVHMARWVKPRGAR